MKRIFTLLLLLALNLKGATLSWNPVPNVIGYRVYFKGAPANTVPFPPLRLDTVADAGNKTSITLSLTANYRYAAIVTAVVASGKESEPSNCVVWIEALGVLPVYGPPQAIKVTYNP